MSVMARLDCSVLEGILSETGVGGGEAGRGGFIVLGHAKQYSCGPTDWIQAPTDSGHSVTQENVLEVHVSEVK